MSKPVFTGVQAEAYRLPIEALVQQRKAVHVPFQGRTRSARCLYNRLKAALKWYKANPEHLPGILEAYKAITVSPVDDGCLLGLKGWIAGQPCNTRKLQFNLLESTLNR